MTNDNGRGAKRPYATPKLITYGDMASLTKSGAGSQMEVTGMMGNMRFN